MAKQTKKLTRDQKELLDRMGYDSYNSRFVEEKDGLLIFVDTSTGNEFWIEKESGPVKKVISFNDDDGVSFSESGGSSFEYNLFT